MYLGHGTGHWEVQDQVATLGEGFVGLHSRREKQKYKWAQVKGKQSGVTCSVTLSSENYPHPEGSALIPSWGLGPHNPKASHQAPPPSIAALRNKSSNIETFGGTHSTHSTMQTNAYYSWFALLTYLIMSCRLVSVLKNFQRFRCEMTLKECFILKNIQGGKWYRSEKQMWQRSKEGVEMIA